MINLFQPTLGENELAALREVFARNWPGRGKKAEEFEARFAFSHHVNPATMLSITSATEGLFLLPHLFDLHRGDEVILPTIHFVGAANALDAAGVKPVFCDVNPATLNPDLHHIDAAYTRKTKAVLVLHYGGHPLREIVELRNWCRERGLYLWEDAACSPLAFSKGHCGIFGDAGVWSFDSMKVISTGDGGMLYLQDSKRMAKARQMLYLGQNVTSGVGSQSQRWWEFEIDYPGRRGLMNDVAAAIGLEQLIHLGNRRTKRRELALEYQRLLTGSAKLSIRFPEILDHSGHIDYFFWVQFENEAARTAMAHKLRAAGVYTSFRYYPLHKLGYYRAWHQPRLLGAEYAADVTLLLPMHAGLTIEQVGEIVAKMEL